MHLSTVHPLVSSQSASEEQETHPAIKGYKHIPFEQTFFVQTLLSLH
jgi:hypothetical protein